MWGDKAHIDKLKEEQQAWPSQWPDVKKTKATDQAIDKASDDLIKWQGKQRGSKKASRATDLINAKAEAWQISQGTKGQRAAHKALLDAERARAKQARWQADQDRYWQSQPAPKCGSYVEPTYYAPDVAPAGAGCSSVVWLLLGIFAALVGLYFCLCGCG